MTTNRDEAEIELMDCIKQTIQNGGKVLVPLFAVGRSQEMQLVLENYMINKPELQARGLYTWTA